MTYLRFVFLAITGLAIVAFSGWVSAAQTVTNNLPIGADASLEKTLARRLIAAKTDEERTLLLQKEPTADQNTVANAILEEAERPSKTVSRGEIERIARIGLHFAELVGNKREIGRAWYAIGNAQTEFADEFDPVKFESYKKGLAAANEASADDLAVKIVIRLGQMQQSMEKEIEWYKTGLANAERYPDRKVLSNLIGRIANAYARKGEYATARQYHSQSLEIKTAMNDRLGIASTISNLGIIYGMQGDMVSALQNFQESFSILESLNESDTPGLLPRKVNDLRNLGIIYGAMGDDSRAMAYYYRSLKISEDSKNKLGIFGALFQIATVYNGRGEYELARQSLRRADGVSDDDQLSVEVIGILANSYVGEGRYEKALNARLRQLAEVEKQGGKNDISETHWQIGSIYLLMQDTERAETHLSRALALALEIDNQQSIYRALVGLSRSRLMAKNFAGALDFAELAKSQLKKLSGVQESWEIYATIGTANAASGKPAAARSNFEKAVAIVEDLRRQTFGNSADTVGLLSRNVTPFHLMIESTLSTNSIHDGFLFAERAKARTLLDSLGQGKLNVTRAMSADEKKTEQNLKNELVSLNAQITAEKDSKERSPNGLGGLEKQLEDKRIEFGVYQNQIYTKHPELKVQRGEMKPISVEETAGLLADERAAVAEFVVAEDRTFLFVITKDAAKKVSLKAFTVDIKDKELGKRVEGYRTKLASGDLGFQTASRELYDLLLKPAAAELAGKTNLIIVPDGPLWDLPFQALQDGKGRYLVENTSISYAPSLTALKEMSKKAKTRPRSEDLELLAFGNPIVGKETSERVKRVFMSEKLEPLPESERLVNELGKMYGAKRSKVYVGRQAREETAKMESPKYRIVQFATHGILNNVSPMYSHLVLAQNDKNPNEDGLLEAWELKDLDLKADMVILSACDTARGKISNGEGVIGMTWASFIAGAPTTVASQWKVESSSTTELMLEFHRQLLSKQKISKAEALRRAALKLMKMPKYKHPSYWAGFVLVGDGS